MNAAVLREKAEADEVGGKFTKISYLMLLHIALGAMQTLVLLLMWHWFIVPLGMRDIGYWHCAGLSVMLWYIRFDRGDGWARDAGKPATQFLKERAWEFVRSTLLALILAATYHIFMVWK